MNFVQSNRGVPSITTNRSLLSNFPGRLTQTVEVTPVQVAKTPTTRTARAKKATATSKSPRGKTPKQTGKVTEQKAKTRARRSLHRPNDKTREVSKVTVLVPRLTTRIVSKMTSARVAAMARTEMGTMRQEQGQVFRHCGTSRTMEANRSQVTPSKDDNGERETDCGGRRSQRTLRGVSQFHSQNHRL